MAHKKSQRSKNRRMDAIKSTVLETCSKPYQDWFPHARAHKRSFILHVGPTNSGKTHDALNAMMAASSGCYLAPLRLLALEVGEDMRDAGIPCDIMTGEDQDHQPHAKHMSSTIELMNANKHYDVAVIDEAQLIADNNRGGAWLTAIMGVDADIIHVCMAPEALEIVERLITLCCDDYTVVKHERKTPLIVDNGFVKINNKNYKPMKGDAIIAFSRKSVLKIAAKLEIHGTRASVIYGALPWRVRKEEARKFRDGETSVVVSTDAIGMGLNLPIRRIIFSDISKYNGSCVDNLKASEVKQIAGRAGRYGIYDEGHVVGTQRYYTKFINDAINKSFNNIGKAKVDIPRELMENEDYKLSEIIDGWINTKMASLFEGSSGMFSKADAKKMLEAAVEIESINNRNHYGFTRDEMIRMISVQFDIDKINQEDEWVRLCNDYGNNHENMTADYPVDVQDDDKLYSLELASKTNSIRFSFARSLGIMTKSLNNKFIKSRSKIDKLMIDKLLYNNKKVSLLKKEIDDIDNNNDKLNEYYNGFLKQLIIDSYYD